MKFGLLFLSIILLMVLWALVLFPAVLLAEGEEAIILGAVLGTLILFPVSLIPYMQFVIGRVYRFKGQGEPVSAGELRQALTAVNELDAPVLVEERDEKLVATWRYVDARWWQIMAKAGLSQVYELHMKLNEDKKQVTLIDIHKSVQWRAGPQEVRLRGGFFRGVLTQYEIGKAWGLKENFRPGKIYDYRFVSSEIKNPFLNTILNHGWGVRFGLW